SGGNQQRINIAVGLLGEPRVLLLDEPSSGLDPSQRIRLWQFVSGLAKAGTTVIYSTHQIEEASHYGDRLVVLADGGTIFDGGVAPRQSVAAARPGVARRAKRRGSGSRARRRAFRPQEGALMRRLFLKGLPSLRPSPLLTGLLIVPPIGLAVLIGLAISRGPE